MKLTSKEAKEILENIRLNLEDDRWINHCICVRTNSRKNSRSIK